MHSELYEWNYEKNADDTSLVGSCGKGGYCRGGGGIGIRNSGGLWVDNGVLRVNKNCSRGEFKRDNFSFRRLSVQTKTSSIGSKKWII